ncbi:MAG: hypothetical protein JZD41_05565 [Thermoproteus sp.]|nr:hypothetical protein [Thermoproteus sp.]
MDGENLELKKVLESMEELVEAIRAAEMVMEMIKRYQWPVDHQYVIAKAIEGISELERRYKCTYDVPDAFLIARNGRYIPISISRGVWRIGQNGIYLYLVPKRWLGISVELNIENSRSDDCRGQKEVELIYALEPGEPNTCNCECDCNCY